MVLAHTGDTIVEAILAIMIDNHWIWFLVGYLYIYSSNTAEVYSGSQLVDGDEMKSYIELSSANI